MSASASEELRFNFEFSIKYKFYPKIWSLWSAVNLSASSWSQQVQVRNWGGVGSSIGELGHGHQLTAKLPVHRIMKPKNGK